LCNDEKERGQLIDNLLFASNITEGRTIVVLTMRATFTVSARLIPVCEQPSRITRYSLVR
jgi:hypothetical protein